MDLTDISHYVYLRDNIVITGGKSDEGSTSQPAQATLTLNNRDNRFTPNYTAGVYYPYLTRNVQLRISLVNATSASGNVYSGYRFWGEVRRWPPASDVSGHDVYCQITAHGPLRRLRQGGGEGSALTRYYRQLTGVYAPIAYWPCEEDPSSNTIIGAGIDGGTNMSVTGTPAWKAVSDFNGSAPVAVVNKSTWDGLTGSFGSGSGNDTYTTPGTYTWVCPATITSVNIKTWGAGQGGDGPFSSIGGGGGEFAQNTAVAVTPGNSYTVLVGAGGSGSTTGQGSAGGKSQFTGDSVTVTGHGGSGGSGGTGSTAPTHFNGGAGGGSASGGGGGGSSAGTAAIGANGHNASGGTGGAGGTAPSGGGNGGAGGNTNANGSSGLTPGGGGGGSGINASHGGNGAAGQVQITYTPVSVPAANIIRWIMKVPTHGGNNGAELLRVITSGTVQTLKVFYQDGGNLELVGYNSVGGVLFDSGNVAFGQGVDSQTVMVSIELTNSGSSLKWAFKAIQPGSKTLMAVTGTNTGTLASTACGNVSEVIVDPSGTVTKTAMGHISVQYGLLDLTRVSNALNGHHTEMHLDRFIRLLNEQAMSHVIGYNEANDHFGFETGVQGWSGAGAHCTVAQSGTTASGDVPVGEMAPLPTWGWPSDGSNSLAITADGTGAPFAFSPTGTSGLPVTASDRVGINVDVYTPTALAGAVFVAVKFFDNTGASLSTVTGDTLTLTAGSVATLKVATSAPTSAAYFNVHVGSNATETNGTVFYTDNVRIGVRLGPQTRKKLHEFFEEIHLTEQGIIHDAKELWGLHYRTRFSLINQTPAVTLDYSQGHISPPLTPVIDDRWTRNDVTVNRRKGSTITVTKTTGSTSVQEPPAGSGRRRHRQRVAAEVDEQLAALASWLLMIGTVPDERYPQVTVNLARCVNASLKLAPLMSAVAGAQIGDMIQLNNLPAWFPATTAKQLIIGYTETLGDATWQIVFNCVPESPYEIVSTATRRW